METKHTPLPWRAVEIDGFYDIHHLTEDNKFHEVVGSEGISKKEDADYIVLACNLHPQLLEALRRLLASHKDLIWSLDNGGRPDMEWTMEIQVVAEEAIALATGSEVAE